MIVTGNPLFIGASGKLKGIVVKQYAGTTVITTVPNMRGRKLSEKQKDINDRMRFANLCAKAMVGDANHKQRACEILNVPPNKVFRAIVKQYMLTDGFDPLFRETKQEKLDNRTLTDLTAIINSSIPDAEITLFGARANGAYVAEGDWDILILTTNDYPPSVTGELQEKLFAITAAQGTRVNILLVQREKWYTEPEYQVLRKRIEKAHE